MKTLCTFLSLFLLSPIISRADSSYLGRAPERGIIITVEPEKTVLKSSDSVLFRGKIKVVGRSNEGEKKEAETKKGNANNKEQKQNSAEGLLEEFKKQDIEITATFPSSSIDVSKNLAIKSLSRNEIEFTFKSPNINAADLNQFSIKVFNTGTDRELLKKLSSIQSKIEKRIQVLTALKIKYESGKASSEAIGIFIKEINKLEKTANEIASRINSDENLLAENVYALQVDNLTSAVSKVSTIMNKFRLMIEARPGNVIDGTNSSFKSSVNYLNKSFGSSNNEQESNEEEDSEKDDYYLAEFFFNNIKIDSKKITGSGKNVNTTIQYDSPRLKTPDLNQFSVSLLHSEDNELKRFGYLNYKIPVNQDSVKPQWLVNGSPSQTILYTKTLPKVSLTAIDSFGRLNLQSFSTLLSGTTLSGATISQNTTDLLNSYMDLDGAQYTWIGNIWSGNIEDGSYTFTASVSDAAGNAAAPYSSRIVIDNVSPIIAYGLSDNAVVISANSTLKININDVSPIMSYVYLNSQKISEIQEKEFNVALNLNPGPNTVEVQSTDAAGNTSRSTIRIILDMPPVASFNSTTNLMSVFFDGSSSTAYIGSISSYVWNFGDGISGFGSTVEHTYGIPGDYQVQLTVTDIYGLESSIVKTVTAIDPPPVIGYAGPSNFYVNTLPGKIIVKATVDKPSVITVNQVVMTDQGGTYSADLNVNSDGPFTLNFAATDIYGTKGFFNKTVNVSYENILPVISTDLKNNLFINQALVNFNVNVEDSISTTTSIIVAGTELMQTGAKQFSYQAYLPNEGENIVQIVAVDAAGNTTTISRKVYKDTIAPTLLSVTPANGESTQQLAFNVSGTASESLKNISIGSTSLTVGSDGKSFSGVYVAPGLGVQQMTFNYSDLAGNNGTFTQAVTVNSVLLIPSLLSVVPDGDGEHMWVIGAPSAVRPGASVNVGASLFGNSASTISDAVGGFGVKLTNFTTAKVTVKDLKSGETASSDVQFGGSTTLAGIVKDTNGNPLVNVKIGFNNSFAATYTDSTGHFVVTNPPTGDQIIYVDARGVTQNPDMPRRTYAVTHIALNVGLGQNNSLDNPIYLTPLMLDGSETIISTSVGGTVTSSYAPGVQLTIPAGATQFPNGGASAAMNIMTVNSSRITTSVPLGFVPTNVISLEPSGTKFTKPVQISIPNDNELPAGTTMIFISMNSAEGKWQLDGIGKVSADGASVVTNPDSGITHFSAVYAVPLAPLIASIENPNLIGIDASEGGLTNNIQAPSFKIYGKDFTPSLTYKSGWANPTAVVSNIFAVPKPLPPQSGTGTGSQSRTGWEKVTNCWEVTWGWEECRSSWVNWLVNVSYKANWESQNLWVPDSVNSQFFVGALASDQVSFVNTAVDDQIKQINGTSISNAAATEILSQTGIPTSAVVSYGVKLIDPFSGDYMESGIHPSLARFQIKLKNLTITTTTATGTRHIWVDGKLVEAKDLDTIVNTGIDTQVLNLLPQDIQSDILLQNKTKSSAGRGWGINGAARIYNPNNSRIMLEEADGNVATYALDNAITTVFESAGSEIDLTRGVDLSQWPYALTGNYFPSSKTSYFAQIDLSKNNPGIINIGQIPTNTGHLVSQNFHQCTPATVCDSYGCYVVYNGTFYPTVYSYQMKFKLGGLIRASNGDIFATSNREHSFVHSGASTSVYGFVRDLSKGSWSTDDGGISFLLSATTSEINGYCQTQTGFNCGSGVNSSTGYNCRTYYIPPFPYAAVKGDGKMGGPSSELPNTSSNWGFNKPSFVTGIQSGHILISDTGNNRVLRYNPTNKQFSVAAGNSQIFDNGDGGTAGLASIFHPTGLASDLNGNIFIASERGFIRKINVNGIISTIAGGGTVMSDQADARTIMLKSPQGLAYDSVHNYLYVADTGNHRVMQIDLATGIANKVAGNNQCSLQNPGDGGSALLASLCSPTVVGLDDKQNLIVVDSGHGKIRRVQFYSVNSGPLVFVPTSNDGSRLFKNANGMWTRQFRNGNYEYFDQNGYQTQGVDRIGRTISFVYDSNKNLNQVQFPNGQKLTYNFSGGYLDSIVDPIGRKTKFSYSDNMLVSVQYPDDTSEHFQYDTNGQMLVATNKNGNNTKFTYNEWSRLTTVTKPDGSTQLLNDIKSQTIANSYNAGSIDPMVNPGFDEGKASTRITNANGVTTQMTTDHLGFISQIKDALGNITKVTRDLRGRPVKVEKPDGSYKIFTYDANTGDLLSVSDSIGVAIAKTYNEYGQVLSETNRNEKTTRYTYDNNTGLLTSVIFPMGNYISYFYNSKGLVAQKVVQNGSANIAMTYSYDANGNIIKIVDNDGISTTFTNDNVGNRLTETQTSTGSDALTKRFSYNSFNQLISVTSPNNEITNYSYLSTGELKNIIDPKNKVTSFRYDVNHRLISKTDAMGNFFTYNYDNVGNRIQETDPNGNVKNFGFDVLNRLISVRMPDDVITYSYDVNGNVIEASNLVSRITNSYDSQGHLLASQLAGIGRISNYPSIGFNYGYDDNGNRTSLATGNGIGISYSYDENDRLIGITSPSGNFAFTYNQAGNNIGITRPGGISAFTYTTAGILSSIQHNELNGTDYESLTYDKRYFPLSKRSPAGQYNFSYDNNGQLTSASNPNPGIATETYSYDSIGNRLTDNLGGNYAYDSVNQRLTDDGYHSYVYDNNGNVLRKISRDVNKESFAFTYNSKNQLIQTQVFTGNALSSIKRQINYTYDVLGRRIQKEVIDNDAPSDITKSYTRQYIYDGVNIFFETDSYGNILAQHTHSSRAMDDILASNITATGVSAGLARSANNYYYLKDHLGSVTSIADPAGNIIQRYDYRSFGKIVSIKSSNGTDISATPYFNTSFTFTGRELDQESGLFYYRARYYDPSIGRFLQQDPHPGKIGNPITVINSYAYAGNNPIMYIDPTGEVFGWDDFFYVLGAALVATIVQNNLEGGNFLNQLGGNFLTSLIFYSLGIGLGGSEIGTTTDTIWQAGWSGVKSGLSQAALKGAAMVANHNKWASEDTFKYTVMFFASAYEINKDSNSELTWNESIGNLVTGGTSDMSHDPWTDVKIGIEQFFKEDIPYFGGKIWQE